MLHKNVTRYSLVKIKEETSHFNKIFFIFTLNCSPLIETYTESSQIFMQSINLENTQLLFFTTTKAV